MTTEAAQELARVQRRRRASQAADPTRRAAAAAASSSAAASAASAASHAPPRAVSPARAHSAAPPHHPHPAPASGAGPAPPQPQSAPFWSRQTIHTPDFVSSRFPSLRGRSMTYSYPTFFYIPPAQRKPLAFIWGIVFLACLGRLLGFIDNSHSSYGYGQPWQHGGRRRRHYEEEPIRRAPVEDDARSTWESTAYSSSSRGYHSGGSIFSFHNLMTLLPFAFFFAGPIIHRWMQQRQRAEEANPQPVHQY